MRRVFVVFAILALLLTGVIPALAQDEEPTIADIVISSTEAEEPQFTVLLAALQAADPGFVEALSDPEGNFTVFAPTDDAFTALLEALEVSAEDLLADTELLNEVLAYHVVPFAYEAEGIVGLDGAYLGTLLPGQAIFIQAGDDGVTAEGAEVIDTDIAAANGVVHVVGSVLLPPEDDMMMEEDMDMATEEPEMAEEEMMEMGTIVDIVVSSTEAEEPQFTILLAAVQAADPIVAEILSGAGPYTVFAPTDAAFEAALEALGVTAEDLLADTETLTNILSYHVAPGEFASTDLVGLMDMTEMMEMTETFVATLNGAPVQFTGETVNEAGLVDVDIFADNGVIHVIDAVLLPPADEEME